MDCSLPVSLSMGILQARILEWVAMPSSRGSSPPRAGTHVSCFAGWFFTAEPPRKPMLYIVVVFLNPLPLSCPHPFPLLTGNPWFVYVSLFLVCYMHLFYFLDYTYKWLQSVCLSLSNISLSIILSRSIMLQMAESDSFSCCVGFHCKHMPHLLYPFISSSLEFFV